MSEAIEILLSVDDQATKAVHAAGDDISKIERSAQKAKPNVVSLEKAGRTAGSAIREIGGSLDIRGLGDAGGAIGDIAEQLQLAGEAAKGARVGLLGTLSAVGAVGVGAFAFGKAIGDVVFQTERWNKELERSNKEADRLQRIQADMQRQAFQDRMALVGATTAEGGELSGYSAIQRQLKTEIVGVESALRSARKEREEWDNAWFKFGSRAVLAEQADKQVERTQEQLDLLKEQERQVDRILTVELERYEAAQAFQRQQAQDDYLSSLRDELQLLEATREEQIRIIAERSADDEGARKEIEMILRRIDLINETKEAEKEAARERERNASKANRDQERAATRSRFDRNGGVQPLAAFESRLLTRGPENPQVQTLEVLKQLKKSADVEAARAARMEQLWYEIAKSKSVLISAPSGED